MEIRGPIEFGLGDHLLCVVPLDDRRRDGGKALSGEIARFALSGQTYALTCRATTPSATESSPADLLSQRELQIASLVAAGKLNKQIADQLRISEWTVSAHLRRIFLKLKVTTRAAMVYRCAHLVGHEPDLLRVENETRDNGASQVDSQRA
jgi:DNA-binding CsgD family transcriptional regulator